MRKFNPKQGDKVSCYYDGKMGRKSEGIVIKRRGFMIEVDFVPWIDEPTKHAYIRAIRVSNDIFGGHLSGEGETGIMRWLGAKGDWYSVGAFDKGENNNDN